MPKYTQNAHQFRAPQGPILPQFVHDYLAYGAQKGDRNDTLFKVAAQYLHAGISEADIAPTLFARAVADGLSAAEARKTITSAFNSQKKASLGPNGTNGHQHNGSTPQPRKFVPGPSSSRPFSMPLPPPIPGGLKLYLEKGFQPGEGVSISGTYVTNGLRHPGRGDLASREDWLSKIAVKPIEKYYPGDEGIFIRINPTTGSHDYEVTSFRHGLFEADEDSAGRPIPLEEQYAALINSHLPCRFIVASGERSIHGIVRLDASTSEEYKRRYALALTSLEGRWIDPKNHNESRYSRVPGVNRRLYDKIGNFVGIGRQELLAIDVGEPTWEEWERRWTVDPTEAEVARVLTVRKVSELSQVQPTQQVEGLLYRGTKMMFAAPSKSFKTWNLLHFLFCIANGLPYMGRRTTKTPVIHCDFELLEFDLWWRLARIAAEYNLPWDPFENFHVITLFGQLIDNQEVDFKNPAVRKFLINEIKRVNAGLFDIDPIYMTYCGQDENSNSNSILTTFDPICRDSNSTFIFNHHFGKFDPTQRQPFDRISGGGIFHRNVYAGVAFTPHREPNAYTVNFTNRGFSAIDPYVVRWQMPIFTPDLTLDPEDLATTKAAQRRNKSDSTEKILAALYGAEREGGLTQKQLAFALKVDPKTIKRNADKLIAKGEIIRAAGHPLAPYQLSPKNADAWSKIAP